jgi:hypothetical protein
MFFVGSGVTRCNAATVPPASRLCFDVQTVISGHPNMDITWFTAGTLDRYSYGPKVLHNFILVTPEIKLFWKN